MHSSTRTNSAVWPVPYACAQSYHPGSGSHQQLFRPYWSSSAWHSRRVNGRGKNPRIKDFLVNFLIPPPYACRGRTVFRFSTNRYHLFTVELALKEVLCTRLSSKGYKVWCDGYTVLVSPNYGETAFRRTGLPTSVGHQTHHVNVIELKWEIIWTGGLPYLSGLPHLPEVPHLHVNRP